jgi:hypothetical protein
MRQKSFILKLVAGVAVLAFAAAAGAEAPKAYGHDLMRAELLDRSEVASAYAEGEFVEQLEASHTGKGPISALTPGWLDAGRAAGENLRRIDLTFNTGVLAGAAISGHAIRPALSADGDFIAFTSLASNILPGDTNGFADVFRYQISTGEFRMVSGGDGSSGIAAFEIGTGPHWAMWRNAISNGGTFVAFTSESTNLGIGDTNDLPDVFRANMSGVSPTYAAVSVDGGGAFDNEGRSMDPSMTDDGNEIAFTSMNNFGNGSDANLSTGGFDVFHKNMTTGALTLVSHEAGLPNTSSSNTPDGLRGISTISQRASISATGHRIAYDTTNPRIVGGGRTVFQHYVAIWDRASNTNTTESLNSLGAELNVNSTGTTLGTANNRPAGFNPSLSPDGNQVAFTSFVNLISGDATAAGNGFAYVRTVGTPGSIRMANSVAGTGAFTSAGSLRGQSVTVGNDGNVAFWATTALSGLDTNGVGDVYYKVFDSAAPAATGPLHLISRTVGGNVGSRGNKVYGDGFIGGAVDRPLIGPGAAFFIFVNASEDLDGETWGLKNIFRSTVDGTFAVTAMDKLTEGDPAVDASISWDESVGNDWTFYKPARSHNGAWVATSTEAGNFFDVATFPLRYAAYIGNSTVAVNTSTGVVALASRNADGSFMDAPVFSFGNDGFNAVPADLSNTPNGTVIEDIFVQRTRGLQSWGADVNNDGGTTLMGLMNFNAIANAGVVQFIWSATSTSAPEEILCEASTPPNASINSLFISFAGSRTFFSGNGRFVCFNTDSPAGVTADSASNGATAGGLFTGYRYDTVTDDIQVATVGRLLLPSDDDAYVVDVSADGNLVAFYNLLASNIGDVPSDPLDTDQNWMRNITTGTTFKVSTSSAGASATTTDVAGLFTGFVSAAGLSADGSRFVFDSNADNLVAGVTGVGGAQAYMKTVTGAHPDPGAIVCMSVSNVDSLPVDTGAGEFAGNPAVSPDGTIGTFESDAADLTAVDTNGAQLDAFLFESGGSPALRLASANAAEDQSVPGSAIRTMCWTIGTGSAFVLFEMDSGDIAADRTAGPVFGGSSSIRSLWIKFFPSGTTAAEPTWSIFE